MNKPIISFSVIILSLGFAFIYVLPAYRLNEERREDVTSLSNILSTSGEIRMLIESTRMNLGTIEQSALDKFEVFLPERVDTIRFANNVQSVARKNGVILSDIKMAGKIDTATNLQTKTATEGLVRTISLGAKINEAQGVSREMAGLEAERRTKYKSTKATLTFSTTHETFQLFLNDLEKSLGVIDVVSLSFVPQALPASTGKAKTAPALYDYAMEIETYSLR